jgi:hypothetical protein
MTNFAFFGSLPELCHPLTPLQVTRELPEYHTGKKRVSEQYKAGTRDIT